MIRHARSIYEKYKSIYVVKFTYFIATVYDGFCK